MINQYSALLALGTAALSLSVPAAIVANDYMRPIKPAHSQAQDIAHGLGRPDAAREISDIVKFNLSVPAPRPVDRSVYEAIKVDSFGYTPVVTIRLDPEMVKGKVPEDQHLIARGILVNNLVLTVEHVVPHKNFLPYLLASVSYQGKDGLVREVNFNFNTGKYCLGDDEALVLELADQPFKHIHSLRTTQIELNGPVTMVKAKEKETNLGSQVAGQVIGFGPAPLHDNDNLVGYVAHSIRTNIVAQDHDSGSPFYSLGGIVGLLVASDDVSSTLTRIENHVVAAKGCGMKIPTN